MDPEPNYGLDSETIRLCLEALNIEARPLWKPMHFQLDFADTPYFGKKVSEHLFEIGLCLPTGSNLTEEDFSRIFSTLDTLFSSR